VPSSEGGAAGLTAKGLDPLGMAMRAIANQGMDVSICDPSVRALVVGAGKALGVQPFGCASPAFDLMPGAHRQGRWPHTRRESGGQAAGGTITWGAWLEQTVDHGVSGPCC
jgi:hypothetical protein